MSTPAFDGPEPGTEPGLHDHVLRRMSWAAIQLCPKIEVLEAFVQGIPVARSKLDKKVLAEIGEPLRGKAIANSPELALRVAVAAGPEAGDHAPEPSETEAAGTSSATGERLSLRRLANYSIRRVVWLDRPFLQRGCFHLLAGRKGSCKGTYSVGQAASCSNGGLYGEPKRVLVVTSEDSIELDFLPRLIAADGDPDMIEIVNGPFLLPRDHDWLRQKALGLGDVGLIIIDPLGSHLGGADTDKEGLVREAIGALNTLADDLDCVVLGIRHLGKDSSRGALAAVLGSTAWVDVPRCVILMAADDEDDLLFHA